MAVGPAIFEGCVLALDITNFPKALAKRSRIFLVWSRRRRSKKTNDGHGRALRQRGKRPRERCAAKPRYEFPPPHSQPAFLKRYQK